MPSQLKQQMKEDLELAAKRTECPDLLDRIADETAGCDSKTILSFLREKKHPALAMWDITQPSIEAQKADALRESVEGKSASQKERKPKDAVSAAIPRPGRFKNQLSRMSLWKFRLYRACGNA